VAKNQIQRENNRKRNGLINSKNVSDGVRF